jgi:hypothetical protein
MASPDPPPLNSKQHPDFARVFGPASPAMEPKAPSSTAVLPVEPELYLRVLARVAAASHQAAWANRGAVRRVLCGPDRRPRVAPSGGLADHAGQLDQGEAVMGDPQRLNDAEQLEILGLLEAVSTDPSAMRAARALAELMHHLHALGERIAFELPDQNRSGKL